MAIFTNLLSDQPLHFVGKMTFFDEKIKWLAVIFFRKMAILYENDKCYVVEIYKCSQN